MHDPSVLVFEIHVPIPVGKWPARTGPRFSVKRGVWTGSGPKAGKPRHRFFRPCGWDVVAFGRRIGWWNVLEVWHEEPDGRDAHTVCKGQRGSQLTWHNVKWAWVHRRHLNIYSPPVRRVVRWRKDRCGECGQPFRWKGDSRTGVGWESREVLHSPCASLRHVRSQLKDATAVLQFTADDNARWRVEYRLKQLESTEQP